MELFKYLENIFLMFLFYLRKGFQLRFDVFKATARKRRKGKSNFNKCAKKKKLTQKPTQRGKSISIEIPQILFLFIAALTGKLSRFKFNLKI